MYSDSGQFPQTIFAHDGFDRIDIWSTLYTLHVYIHNTNGLY